MYRNAKVILLDPDTRRRAAVAHTLAKSGMHADPYETVEELGRRWPDHGVVLLYDQGTMLGDLLESMKKQCRWLPVACFSEDINLPRVVETILDGAIDYLTWPFSREIVDCFRERASDLNVANGHRKLREVVAKGQVENLSRRERQVLGGIVDGLTNRMIGQKLAISPRTVEIHRSNMLEKLGVERTSEAIRIAVEAAL